MTKTTDHGITRGQLTTAARDLDVTLMFHKDSGRAMSGTMHHEITLTAPAGHRMNATDTHEIVLQADDRAPIETLYPTVLADLRDGISPCTDAACEWCHDGPEDAPVAPVAPAPVRKATRGAKYGIKFATIRYWQGQARSLNHTRGLKAVGCLEQPAHQLASIDARRIGHDAIMTATVHSAQEVRNLLDTGATWNQRAALEAKRLHDAATVPGFDPSRDGALAKPAPASDYRVEDGIIVSPGKFEAEAEYVPTFWDVVLNGCADETLDDDGREVSIVLVTDEDRARWPALVGFDAVALVESDHGFISAAPMPAARLDKYRASCEAAAAQAAQDEDEQNGPQDDDLVTSDGITFYYHGDHKAFHLIEGSDGMYQIDAHPRRHVGGKYATVERAIRAFMQAEQYWPNVWTISDHGNAHLMDLGRA